MRRALLLSLLLLAACPEGEAGAPDAAPSAPVKVTVAQLSGLKGKVTLTRAGQSVAAAPGPLFEGDVLDTGADGHALLVAKGREVELLASSRFRVGATLADLALSLGELMFEESDGGEFNTAAGAARTGAGSRVKLAARDGGTTFEVGMGTLELLDAVDGGASTVKAGERFVLGLGVLSLEEPPKLPPEGVKTKVKLTPRGAVTLKPKSGPSAKVPAEGRELDEVSAFTIEKGGGLRAELDGAAVEFEGASKGSIDPSGKDPKLGITLSSGGARIFLKAGESVLLGGGKKPLTVRAKKGSTLVVTATKEGPRVEVLGGETEVSLEGSLPRNLGASEVATPRGKGLDTGRRGAPILTLPANRNTHVYWGKAGDVALSFPASEGVMEVSADSQFQSLLASAEGSDLLTVRCTGDAREIPRAQARASSVTRTRAQ